MKTLKKNGPEKYFPAIDFFTTLLEQRDGSDEIGKIFTVSYNGRIIGGSCCLFSDDTVYMLFSGGMRKSYPSLYPGVLAVWNAMLYSREKGYSHFEFIFNRDNRRYNFCLFYEIFFILF